VNNEPCFIDEGDIGCFDGEVGGTGGARGCSRLIFCDAFGVALIGSYLPSATARAPEDEPSTNSIGGGSRLLKASISLAG
jgi:hypothetical protein